MQVEVFAVDAEGGLLSAVSALPEKFAARADEIADSVVDVAEGFRRRLAERRVTEPDDSDLGLDEVKLTFQLTLEASSGVVIAAGKAGATFSVDVVWRRRPPGPPAEPPVPHK